jgi:hypothetical protein
MDIDLCRQGVPDTTMSMGFRHLLEANHLAQAMLAVVNAMYFRYGILMTKGTLVTTAANLSNISETQCYCMDREGRLVRRKLRRR